MADQEAPEGMPKGFLDKHAGALVAAVLTCVVGVLGVWHNMNASATNNQLRRLELIERQVQFESSQQMAANKMRADALDAMEKHIAPHLDGDSRKVAALAAFHSSYGEFFDTRPVLAAFAKTIKDAEARDELRRLAQRVARRQKNVLLAADGDTMRLEFEIASGGVVEKEVNGAGHLLHLRFESVVCEGLPTDRVRVVLSDEEHIRESFDLSYLDAPMMDNIAVRHNDGKVHFVALNLLEIEKQGSGGYVVVVDIVHFAEGAVTSAGLRWRLLRDLREDPLPLPDHVHKSN